MTSSRHRLLALLAASTLLVAGGCDKDKDAAPPAELVEIRAVLAVDEVWSDNLGSDAEKLRLALGLAEQDGVLYAGSRDGTVRAFDAAKGTVRWSVDTKAELSSGPGVYGGLVALGTTDGRVVALDATNGQKLWHAKVGGEVLSAPLVTTDRVLVRTVDGRLRALDGATGKELWSAEELVPRLTLRGNAPPALAGDAVIAGYDSGKIVAYALATGDVRWQAQVASPRGRTELERLSDVDSAIHVEGGDGYAVGYQGRVVMFALDSGQVWWGRELSSYRGLALDADQLYVATSDGHVAALRRRDGTVLWQQEGLKRRNLSAPAVIGDAVVVGDYDGYLHWLDRATGTFVARERVGKSRIGAAPVVVGDRVFVLDEAGKLVAFRVGGSPGR